jgi:SAM-dependent methyltransferase
MHKTAQNIGSEFIKTYVNDRSGLLIVDVGSSNVNGSLKKYINDSNKYIGLDLLKNDGVDIVLNDPYSFPFDDNSVDVILCTSVFEHCEFFWELYLEIMRVLKPDGLFYLNVPSHGEYHTYPIDSWRFYPDAGLSLMNWGRKNEINCDLIESFIMKKQIEGWNDFVAIFIKDGSYKNKYKKQTIAFNRKDTVNIISFGKKYKYSISWNSFGKDFLRVLYKKIKSHIRR